MAQNQTQDLHKSRQELTRSASAFWNSAPRWLLPVRTSVLRVRNWIREQVVQEVPEEIALCAFDCRKGDCTHSEWEACARRRSHAAGATTLDGPEAAKPATLPIYSQPATHAGMAATEAETCDMPAATTRAAEHQNGVLPPVAP